MIDHHGQGVTLDGRGLNKRRVKAYMTLLAPVLLDEGRIAMGRARLETICFCSARTSILGS